MPLSPLRHGRRRRIDRSRANGDGLPVAATVHGDVETCSDRESARPSASFQEALTTPTPAAMSGGALGVAIEVGWRGALTVPSATTEVARPPPPGEPASTGGFGLLGMRERVGLTGGTLGAVHDPRGGFEVWPPGENGRDQGPGRRRSGARAQRPRRCSTPRTTSRSSARRPPEPRRRPRPRRARRRADGHPHARCRRSHRDRQDRRGRRPRGRQGPRAHDLRARRVRLRGVAPVPAGSSSSTPAGRVDPRRAVVAAGRRCCRRA